MHCRSEKQVGKEAGVGWPAGAAGDAAGSELGRGPGLGELPVRIARRCAGGTRTGGMSLACAWICCATCTGNCSPGASRKASPPAWCEHAGKIARVRTRSTRTVRAAFLSRCDGQELSQPMFIIRHFHTQCFSLRASAHERCRSFAQMDADYYIKNKCAARNRQRTACQRHAIELRPLMMLRALSCSLSLAAHSKSPRSHLQQR
jgi:hypothetical protein